MTKVKDLMTREVLSVKPETPFKDVLETLLRHDLSGVPVVDDDGRLLGIVTEADLVSREAYAGLRRRPLQVLVDLLTGDVRWVQKAKSLTAEALMTPWPFAIHPADDVSFAARRMLAHRVKRLPVVDYEGRVVGILSRHDVLRVFDRPDEDIAADLRDRLGSARFAPDDHEVTFTVDQGVVTLEGTVLHPSDVPVVESLARHVPGVVAVEIRLEAREPEPTLR
ncbi:MAG: CBS domain-containing protein [Actinomycetota bacterium]|jgi:CBS domain-containing protein